MLPLIIESSPFLCIIAIFLNNNLWKIRCLSNLLKWFDFYWRLLDKEVHFYKDCYDMFHIHKIFYQMITVENGFTWHTQLKKLKRNFKQFFIFFLPKNWISLKKIYISFSQIFLYFLETEILSHFIKRLNSISLYLWIPLTFPYFIIFSLYSTSLCFSDSGRFVFHTRLQNDFHKSIFEYFLCLLIISG